MHNEYSTIQSRQELKKLYRAGAITSEEYEAYKKRLVYGIPIPIKPRPATPTPAGSLTSFFSGKPTETKIIYPNQLKETNQSIATWPGTKLNYSQEKPLLGEKPDGRKKILFFSLIIIGVLSLLNLLAYWYLHHPSPAQIVHNPNPEVEKTTAANVPPENLPASTIKSKYESLERVPLISTNKAIVATPKAKLVNRINNAAASATRIDIITNKNEIIKKAQQQLNAYYNDMQAPPFDASNYFAPRVDRYYTLSNTTPVAITKNINRYHFSEFLKGQSIIQEGTMQLVNANNSGYELTYLEHGSAFRKSKKLKQEVKAKVRVRFNLNFKITYFRQEQLLQNRFIKE